MMPLLTENLHPASWLFSWWSGCTVVGIPFILTDFTEGWGPLSAPILRFGVANIAVVCYIHPEFPDSVLASSCASQGWENSKNIMSMFLRWWDLGRVTICMGNALGKTKSAEGRWSELLDTVFPCYSVLHQWCSWEEISKLVSFKCQTFLN